MKEISWEMNEQFYFPAHLGTVANIESVKISPQWLQQANEDGVRLDGVYHMAIELKFDQTVPVTSEQGILIEDLDFNNATSYFEYALPLHIDLPSIEQPVLQVSEQQASIVDGCCHIAWTMQCQYKEKVEVFAAEQAIIESPIEEVKEDILVETDDFYAQLSDAYKVFQSKRHSY